jgi:error-prone DNA polymerase
VTAWLKCHQAPAFYCALLNQQPMGFYSVRVVVEDAKRHGIGILPLRINASGARWQLEDGKLRVPFARLKGLGEDMAEQIAHERDAHGPYRSLWDFVRRIRPPRALVERLIRAGAMEGLDVQERRAVREMGVREPGEVYTVGAGIPPTAGAKASLASTRRSPDSTSGPVETGPDTSATSRAQPPPLPPSPQQLLWALGEMQWEAGGLDLPPAVTAARMPEAGPGERLAAEAGLLGLVQSDHPFALLRPRLAQQGLVTNAEAIASPEGTDLRVAGRVEIVQRPGTAKGIAFVSLEDETGLINLLCYPKVYAAARRILREAPVVVAEGRVQHEHGAMHLIVRRILDLAVEQLG